MTLDQLVEYDADVREIQQVIARTSEETQQKIDWTKLWGQMYPILTQYQEEVEIERYTGPLQGLIRQLEQEYGYTPQDAFLVLKDILGKLWIQGQGESEPSRK